MPFLIPTFLGWVWVFWVVLGLFISSLHCFLCTSTAGVTCNTDRPVTVLLLSLMFVAVLAAEVSVCVAGLLCRC